MSKILFLGLGQVYDEQVYDEQVYDEQVYDQRIKKNNSIVI
jgi:hypothetical protein